MISQNILLKKIVEMTEKEKNGTIFSCARDFALINGFNEKITLRRTQTIWEGADHCDFCYTAREGN